MDQDHEFTQDDVMSRKRTTVEKEIAKRRETAHEVVSKQLAVEQSLHNVDPYIPIALAGAIFCGHLVTDLDSIAGAIGAAELYGTSLVLAFNLHSHLFY